MEQWINKEMKSFEVQENRDRGKENMKKKQKDCVELFFSLFKEVMKEEGLIFGIVVDKKDTHILNSFQIKKKGFSFFVFILHCHTIYRKYLQKTERRLIYGIEGFFRFKRKEYGEWGEENYEADI